MWLFFRHQEATAGDGSMNRPGWEAYAVFYQGSSWSTPLVLPRSMGRLDMPLALDASADGTLWMAWLTDHRSIHRASPDSRTLQEDVVVGRLELPRAGEESELRNHQPREEPIEPYHRDEPGDLDRIRSYRIEVDGRTYRIVRGDMHRHTDYSGDGTLDGSLHETYRYALDAASLDFLAVTDHYPGEYVWWETQKSIQRFHLPGRFVPLLGYERNMGYPNGHRNVVFAGRGAARTPGRAPGAFGSRQYGRRTLRLPQEVPGLSMPHTSGTPTMGTDWRDHAGDVEPLVEIFQGDRTSYERPGAPLAAVREDASTHRGGYLEEGFVWKAWEKGYRLGVQASSDHWSTPLLLRLPAGRAFRRPRLDGRHAPPPRLRGHRQHHSRFPGGRGRPHPHHGRCLRRRFGSRYGFTPREPDRWPMSSDPGQPGRLFREPGRSRVGLFFLETDPTPGTHFYYVRLHQADGHVAWSSPIWITYR